jgi:hybrid cluster-associated redox disulfide protein
MIVDENSRVSEIIEAYPDAVRIFIAHGMPCLVCGEAFWGTLSELARRHNVDAKKIIERINESIAD